MIYYHGSIVPNLKKLQPFLMPHSNVKTPCVYFASTKELALLYLWVRKFMWLTYRFDDKGVVIYTESFPDSLFEFYGDVKGYIYACDLDESTIENKSGIQYATHVDYAVPIQECEIIDDAYKKILKYEKEGKMIIRRFNDLTEKEHLSNRKMVLSAIKRLNLLDNKHPLSPFVKEKYPLLWKEAVKGNY